MTVNNKSLPATNIDTMQQAPRRALVPRKMTFAILQNLTHIVTHITKKFNLIKEASKIGRPSKIKETDALAFALYQHTSTRATKKSVYDDCKEALDCTYKTFVESVNRATLLSLRILFVLMRLARKFGHPVKYTDATDVRLPSQECQESQNHARPRRMGVQRKRLLFWP